MSSPNDNFQRAWLDVRCSKIGSAQYDRKMKVFLDSFLASFFSRRDSRFKKFFSNGNELLGSLCKSFVASSVRLLSRDDRAGRADSLADDVALNEQLVRALTVLVNPCDFPGKEIAELSSSFEIVEESGVVTTLLELHERQVAMVLSADEGGPASAALILDVRYLNLTANLLGCSQAGFIKRSVAAATQRGFIRLMATTMLKCTACCATAAATASAAQSSTKAAARPVSELDSIAEAAARVFMQQARYAPGLDNVQDALDILETGANSTPAKPGDAPSLLAALACYTSVFESIICVRARFGFYEPETVSFSVTTAHILGSEGTSNVSDSADTVVKRDRLCHRLAKCLEMFATADRWSAEASPSGTPTKKRLNSGRFNGGGGGGGSFFQLVPGTFSKLQQKLTLSLTGGDGASDSESRSRAAAASPVRCTDAVVSMVTVFVSTRVPHTADMFGATLFRILRYRHVPYDLVALVFNVCADKMRSLGARRLHTLLEFVGDIARTFDITSFVRCVVEKFKDGSVADAECRLLVLDFVLTYSTRSAANAAVVLNEGLFAACLVALSGMLLESRPNTKVFTDKVAVLAKVVVQSPQAAQALEGQNVPRLLLDAMLLACRLKVPAVSVMLRDMFTSFVVKTGSFYSTLITAIANCSDSTPWRGESSSLLATLVTTMQGGKFVEEAIDKNAVELCLTMVHDVAASSAPVADLQLLGSCLGFLLPRVCYSDVWSLFEASVGRMRCTNAHAQFMIDLSSGYFTSAEKCAACQRYFETGEARVLVAPTEAPGSATLHIGPFSVPQRPFLQLQYPLKTLMFWCSHRGAEVPSLRDDAAARDAAGESDVETLRAVVEHLLIASEAKLPNDYFGDYIFDSSRALRLLCCVRDVTAPRYLPLFFGAGASSSLADVWQRETAWLAVLCPQDSTASAIASAEGAETSADNVRHMGGAHVTPIEYRFNARFAETGGATGVVSCAGEQWPSPDGYSVAMWVHWESMHASAPSDRKNVFWQLSWSTASGTGFTLSLSMNPRQRSVFFTCQEGSDARVTPLPFIAENKWVHVTLCHHRGKLFGSQLKVYFDGVLMQAANCPYPSNAIQAAVAVAAAGVLPPMGGSRDVTCTVGAPTDKPNGPVSLRFISLHVFNYALAVESVVALFCSGAQCNSQGGWDSPAESTELSLLAPYLSDAAVRALVVHQATGSLDGLCQRETVPLRAAPKRALVHLHVQSMHLVEAPLGHVRSNHRWVIANCTSAPSTAFPAHGNFIPPQAGMANEVDALLSHRAMYEWVCWLDAISVAAKAARQGRQPQVPNSAEGDGGETEEGLQESEVAGDGSLNSIKAVSAARAFLRVLAASNKQTELSPSSWRRLLGRLIEEAIQHPEVFLCDEASLRPLLSLSVRGTSGRTVSDSGSPAASQASSSTAQGDHTCFGAEEDGILYFTTLTEHIFFNWKVLARLPDASYRTVLTVFEELLSPNNAFSQVNALRFVAADFVNGFVCGMFREFVEPARLLGAVHCVGLMLRALWHKADFLSDVLTLCAVSTNPDTVALGSRLAATCPSYAALIRNLLLRAINATWDSMGHAEQRSFARTLSSVLAAPWFVAMTRCTVHAVTAALATRIFVICFQCCESFRDQFRGERLLCLVETLSSHAHQRDVVDVVFYAVLGLVWPLPPASASEELSQGGRCSYESLPLHSDTGPLPFLDVLLFLVKRLSQLLLMRPDDLMTACRGDGPLVNAHDYFAAFFNRAVTARRSQEGGNACRARFKRIGLVVRCVVRLAKSREGAGAAALRNAPQVLAPSPGASSVISAAGGSQDTRGRDYTEEETLKVAILASIRSVLDWLSSRYRGSRGLKKALYRSDDTTNSTDLLCWPLLCTLDARSVAMPAAAEQRGADVEAALPQSPSMGPQRAEDKTRAERAEEDGWEDVGKDFEPEEDDEEDWEMLPAVVATDSRSIGLDRLRPRAGLESLYDSCRSFYLTHALERVKDGEEFALPRGRVRMSKFVLALHRALAAEPRAVGSQLEDCRAAFLCSVWLKAAEQSVDADSLSSSFSPPGLKNVLSLGDYLLSRLVSGAAVPPLGLSSFFRFLLARLDRNTEVVRRSRTCLFEWLMYIMNTAYYKYDGPRAAAVVDMLMPNAEVLFAAPMPAGDLLRVVAARLMELTHSCLTAAGAAGSDGSAHASLRRLATIWSLFVKANRDASALLGVLQGPGRPDLWTDGFDTLLQHHSSSQAAEHFVAWLVVNKVALWQCLQGVHGAQLPYAIAEGGKYAKVLKTSVHLCQQRSAEVARFMLESSKRNDGIWASFLETNTFIDPAIVEHGGFTFPNSCVVMPNGSSARGVANELQWWFLHQSGAVGIKELYAHENVDDLASEPISLYIRYPPPIALPARLNKADTSSPFCSLRWNALSVLAKITGQSTIRWVGNVYYVVGNDSRICTITVTDDEVVLISCSEFTKEGDFFIAQIRPQTARQKSDIKTTFVQQTWRRLLSTAGGVASGGAGGGQHSGTATSSKAAFRYSQYYRQLRTEALGNADALVWRFPLGQVASVHERLFQHMPAGLEFVLETGERYLVVVLDEELSFSRATRDKLQGAIAELAPMAEVETMATKRAKLSVTTRRWANGEVSNYAYLMALNDAASRTVADIGQYPVMPWVLKEYRSDSIDLDNPAVYRDLTKPVGALNAAKAEQLRLRYRDWIHDSEPPFHYGTHYSSGAIVLYYLIRLQPFTARSISYQGGRLDIADRLFHSLPEAWENGSGTGTGDVKELIPEFFSQEAFFLNKNHTALGARRDGRNVHDVVLPPWAKESPTVFTHVNALALESPLVSEHLNDWVDLIFGYKQTGEAAVAALNVFHNLSYQEGVEQAISSASSEESKKAIVASADNFGQTPVQLFTKGPHVLRNPAAAAHQQSLIADVKSVQQVAVVPEGRLVTATRGAAFTQLFEVDHVAYGCPSNHTLAVNDATEIFVYDGRTDSISSTLACQTRPNASLPPIGSLGCGEYACMCTSTSGNLLCVGTTAGKVVVFTRASPRSRFAVTAVLHSSPSLADGVGLVQLFSEGSLVVCHARSATVTHWHISSLGCMFCYQLHLPSCGTDQSHVVALSRDEQRGVLYGARASSLVLLSREGELLRQFDLLPYLDALSVKLSLRPDSPWEITSMQFCNCTSFHEDNLLLLGHQNGCLTFWVVHAQTFSNRTAPQDFYELRYAHCVVCEHAVTSLLLLRSGGVILAGLANGTMRQFCYPFVNDDAPLLMP